MLRTTYLDRRLQLQQDRLVNENLPGLGTKVLDLVFLKLYRLARSITPHC